MRARWSRRRVLCLFSCTRRTWRSNLRRTVGISKRLAKEVYQALLDALTGEGALARVVYFGTGYRLNHIVGERRPLADIVFDVIQWGVAHNELGRVLEAVKKDNPTRELKATLSKYRRERHPNGLIPPAQHIRKYAQARVARPLGNEEDGKRN